MSKFKTGDAVFDRASELETTIVKVERDGCHDYYTVGNNVPLDPTKDGAFDRWRCESEICGLADPQRHEKLIY